MCTYIFAIDDEGKSVWFNLNRPRLSGGLDLAVGLRNGTRVSVSNILLPRNVKWML